MIRHRKHVERPVDAFTAADWIALERSVGYDVHYCRDEAGKLIIGIYRVNQYPYCRSKDDAYIAGKWKARAWEDANPNWKELVVAALDAELLAGVMLDRARSKRTKV